LEYRLLEKTELWISPVELEGADLTLCARAAARVLGLNPEEIMVTDVLEDRLTLDILVPTIQADRIVAREKDLLEALASIPGIHVKADTKVHSDGVLGLISLDAAQGKETLERSRAMGSQIAEHIRKRAVVFATGSEVLKGQIQDTNTPFLIAALRSEGYHAVQGGILEDKVSAITRAFRRVAESGYGLILTTGGVGAEGKDQTLEALVKVDPRASLPYILTFRQGQGRHAKDGVRIGVGVLEQARIVCLPGPHDEVLLAWPALLEGMKTNENAGVLAEAVAKALRRKFLSRSGHPGVISSDHPLEVSHGSE
jgi:molybdenum cofactor synthesis domain-containing protein